MGQKWDNIQFNYLFFIDADKLLMGVKNPKKTPLVAGLGVTSQVLPYVIKGSYFLDNA